MSLSSMPLTGVAKTSLHLHKVCFFKVQSIEIRVLEIPGGEEGTWVENGMSNKLCKSLCATLHLNPLQHRDVVCVGT